tara:strand:+ start:45797 stop:46447 length:651 start_codon:yes stop_codon:yes gene_type:complete
MSTLVDQNNLYGMKENIYIKALEIGFENETTGISFNEIVEKLDIESGFTKSLVFKSNFTIWFYTNFFNPKGEANVKLNNSGTSTYVITPDTLKDLDKCKAEKSFIKGEATQKYIDYLELKEARESAQTARKFSILSIIIASIAILTPILITEFKTESPKQVIVTENRDKVDNEVILERLTKIDSTITSTITKLSLIADKKVEVSTKKQAKVKSVKH